MIVWEFLEISEFRGLERCLGETFDRHPAPLSLKIAPNFSVLSFFRIFAVLKAEIGKVLRWKDLW